MTKSEFLNKLDEKLKNIDKSERKRLIAYYSELIDDMCESGSSEEEAVNSLGNINDLVNQINEDTSIAKRPKKNVNIVLLILAILGFPVWFSIGCAALSIIVSILAAIFSVAVAIVVSEIALFLGGVVLLVSGIVLLFKNFAAAAFSFGLGLIAIGLAALLATPIIALIKLIINWLIKLYKKIFHK